MKHLLLSAVALFAVACTAPAEAPAEEAAGAPEKLHNNITEAEIIDGWELMFDGQCLGNFRTYGDTVIGKAWVIEDEALHLDASNKEDWQVNGGGDIVYQDFDGSMREFENFHFKGEWKIGERGNSGIIYLIHEDTEHYSYCWMTGLEMQVLDNGTDSTEGHPDAAIPKHRAGDLYDINAAPEDAAKFAGEWNRFEIIVQNGHLTQKLNGVVTVDRDLFDDAWRADVAASKFHEFAGYGTYRKGGIALQDHGDNVWYRNLKIKEIQNDKGDIQLSDSLFNSRVSKKPLLTFSDSEISVLIECLVSDTIKYEYNKKCELVFPDSVNGMPRVLNCPYPCNYGFSENFVSQDGDYLDAFVFAKEKPNRGENIICMPRFIILMTDNGEEDSKLICSRDSMSLKIEEVKGFLQNYSIDNIQIDHIIDLRCKPLDYGSLIKRYQINLKHPASVDMFNTSYVFGEF